MFCRVGLRVQIAGQTKTNPVGFLDLFFRWKGDQHDVQLADVLNKLGSGAVVGGAVERQDIGIEIAKTLDPNDAGLAAGEAKSDLFVFVKRFFRNSGCRGSGAHRPTAPRSCPRNIGSFLEARCPWRRKRQDFCEPRAPSAGSRFRQPPQRSRSCFAGCLCGLTDSSCSLPCRFDTISFCRPSQPASDRHHPRRSSGGRGRFGAGG